MTPVWPEPIRQIPGTSDCGFVAAAYACRLAGHEVDIETIRDWSKAEQRFPEWYLHTVLGVPMSRPPYEDGNAAVAPWYLGPDGAEWVGGHLARGRFGFACVYTGGSDMHAVIILEADDTGVLLMDPMQGFVRWEWPRFLGKGQGARHDWREVHRIGAWIGPVPA